MRDKKVKLLRAEFGASSVVFVLYVFCRAFEGDGYFLKWDKDECLIAADELKESPAYISEVLQGCLARSLFDQGVYQMFGALTSAGIQRRYLRGCEKRDGIEMIAEYWLLDEEDKNDVPPSILNKLTFFTVSGGKNGINSPGNPVNSPGNPQSKVKERKVKKSKEYNEAAPADAGDGQEYLVRLPLKDGKNFTIPEADVKQWEDLYPLVNVQQELKLMLGWLQGNPQKRKTMAGIKRFIHAWLARAQQNGGKGYGVSSGASKEQPGGEKSVGKVQRHGDYF